MSEHLLPFHELNTYLQEHVEGFVELLSIDKFTGGQSNPSYKLTATSGNYVLRTQPSGKLLKSAHQVDREYRVMQALARSEVPVPHMYHLAVDENPLSRKFVVMEYLNGQVFWDPLLAELENQQRSSIYKELCKQLAAIHSVDIDAAGLFDYGRPGNYFERQVGIWTRNYRASVDKTDAGIERLISWLEKHMPADDQQISLVHGDYRLDNVMFHRDLPTAIGILDWELSTLGHPMADLAYQCMQWRLPSDGGMRGLGDSDRTKLGIPSEQEYVSTYCSIRNIDWPSDWKFYLAFSFFRLAAILQGVYSRYLSGNASNPEMAVQYGKTVPVLVALALEEIDK